MKRMPGVPFLYTRGTHFEVGFDIGRTFKGMIQNYVATDKTLNDVYLMLYETDVGQRYYDETLAKMTKHFPQYVQEIKGTAEGAQVDFHKLFLLHIEESLIKACRPTVFSYSEPANTTHGCTDICINRPDTDSIFIGHTEDTVSQLVNNYYFVSVHIVEDAPQGRYKTREEKFTSLCYAGQLPGYTMSFNHHGLVYSINSLRNVELSTGRTPRTFLLRALLAARNYDEALEVLKDVGEGVADGCAVNMAFLNDPIITVYNVEVGPNADHEQQCQIHVATASPGQYLYHTNQYLRLPIEVAGIFYESSLKREAFIKSLDEPKTKLDLVNILGHTRVVFHSEDDDPLATIACGIFNLKARTWEIYTSSPKVHEPVLVIQM